MVDAETYAVDALSESKLHPPPIRPSWIERERLVLLLENAVRRPIVLVAAPAGYGKTTVLTQWLVSERAPVRQAWVCLDLGDNDPTRLWVHLAAALHRAGCPVDDDPVDFVTRHSSAISTRVVPQLTAAMAASDEPVVLVLDDCHVLRSPEAVRGLDELVQTLPAQAHLVLLTRSDPALRLGRLRVDGKLAEIRSRDLAFTADEVETVLQTEQVQLGGGAVQELLRRAEGWPAAVYLAALSLRGREDPDGFVRALSGNNRFVADYLTEEVLNRLQADVRAFILEMAVFEQFNAALGDHVRGSATSGRMIRELERTNLFLIPLDDEGRWFRFHHLFGSFARSALEAEEPERIAALRSRGTDWFIRHGHIDEAVHHALAAGDTAQASLLLQQHWVRYFDAGRETTVHGWLRALRGSPEDTSIGTVATAAWMAALSGQTGELRARLAMLDASWDDQPLPDRTTSAESAAALIRGLFGFEGPDSMRVAAARAVELETDPRTPWYTVAHAGLGHVRYLDGALPEARAELADAAYSPSAPATVRVLAFALMSFVDCESGNSELSRAMAEASMDVVRTARLQTRPQGTWAYSALGMHLALDGQLEEAYRLLDESLRVRRLVPGLSPWPTIYHLLVLAPVAARTGRTAVALDAIAELDDLDTWPGQAADRLRDRIRATRTLVEALVADPAGTADLPPSATRRPARVPTPALTARAEDSRTAPAPDLPPTPPGLRAGPTTSRTPPDPSAIDPAVAELLTSREIEVLRRLQGEQSLREIAADLYISHNTIKTFTLAIYRKLGAHSRPEAVAIARRRSMI